MFTDDIREEGEVDQLKDESEIPVEELLRRYYPELYDNESSTVKDETNNIVETAGPKIKSNSYNDSDKLHDIQDKFKELQNKDESDEPCHLNSKRRRIARELRSRSNAAEDNTDLTDDSSNLIDDETESTATEDDGEDEGSDEDLSEGATEDDIEEDDNTKLLVAGEEFSEFSDVIEMAAQFQPTGNTLDTTNVKTKIPFLLKHKMREYQHIGLDWLVSMYERKLNGILADEMGLGKTIETIALLAHLACDKEIWGPHLIVVPTSVMLNWEMELKKWAPAFKIVTYYGNQKERRLKRVGWSKPNAFHICITSYKLVTQDHQR